MVYLHYDNDWWLNPYWWLKPSHPNKVHEKIVDEVHLLYSVLILTLALMNIRLKIISLILTLVNIIQKRLNVPNFGINEY